MREENENRKTEYSYLVTECDLKFGEQITLDGELLIPASVLDKIRAEIEEVYLNITYKENHKVGGTWD